MRIVIDGRTINDHFPGIGRYVYNIVRALGELAPPHQFVLLHNPGLPNTRHDIAALARYPAVRVVAARVPLFSAAEQTMLPRMLRAMRADLFHAPYYVRPYFGLPCPSVTTLYDAIPRLFPNEVSPRARAMFDLLTRLAIRASSRVLAISGSARDDLVAAYRIPAGRIAVTPLAADPRMRPQPAAAIAAMRAQYDLPERYVLALSSNKPHKNLPALVAAFAGVRNFLPDPRSLIPEPILIIAGHWDARYPAARATAERLGLGQAVHWLPGIAEADVPALLGGAHVFAFPSRYEGFGLPPLEAMACGAPVLCCDTSSLPEVVGDAALRVAPTAEALAAGLARLLGDGTLREQLRVAGIRRAARFSWRATAEMTLHVYETSILRS